jgi:hypothetical protein
MVFFAILILIGSASLVGLHYSLATKKNLAMTGKVSYGITILKNCLGIQMEKNY